MGRTLLSSAEPYFFKVANLVYVIANLKAPAVYLKAPMPSLTDTFIAIHTNIQASRFT